MLKPVAGIALAAIALASPGCSKSTQPAMSTPIAKPPAAIASAAVPSSTAPPSAAKTSGGSALPTWLPPRDQVDAGVLPDYDAYTQERAAVMKGQQKVNALTRRHTQLLHKSEAATKQMKKGQIPYSSYIKQYDNAMSAYDDLSKASHDLTQLQFRMNQAATKLQTELGLPVSPAAG